MHHPPVLCTNELHCAPWCTRGSYVYEVTPDSFHFLLVPRGWFTRNMQKTDTVCLYNTYSIFVVETKHANHGSQYSSVPTYTLVVHNVALYRLGGAQDDFVSLTVCVCPSLCLGLWNLRCAPIQRYTATVCTIDLRCALLLRMNSRSETFYQGSQCSSLPTHTFVVHNVRE